MIEMSKSGIPENLEKFIFEGFSTHQDNLEKRLDLIEFILTKINKQDSSEECENLGKH